MSNRIKILDPITANQIAAGEVVERPASVVKELVENAVDAGAGLIEIEVAGAGVELIRVTDNGCGMEREDAILSFQRHATSKISSSADLEAIATLGFRGEALPSIASVSELEVITREPVSLEGTRLFISGGKITKVQDAGCPVGTTFLIKDLFYNTPARRKFLKSAATELGQISDVINRMAMAYPGISFKFINQGRVLLHTSGKGNLLEAVSQVYGRELSREMIPIKVNGGDVSLDGLLGRPQHSRSNRAQQTFFINGRYIRSKALTQAIAEGYHTLVPGNRFPIVVLNLELQANMVDVNVHPTKLEVRFVQEVALIDFVSTAVREVLTGNLLIPGIKNPDCELPRVAEQNPLGYQLPTKSEPLIFKENKNLNRINFNSEHDKVNEQNYVQQSFERMTKVFSSQEMRGFPESIAALSAENYENSTPLQLKQEFIPLETAPEDITKQEELSTSLPADTAPISLTMPKAECTGQSDEPERPLSKLPDLQPFGQIDLTYIIANGPEGLYIIDQHAAHERLNYEEIWAKAVQGKIEAQMLLNPITMEFTNQEMELLVENILLLSDLGLLLEHFGGNTFLLRGHPVDIDNPQALVRDLLEQFADGEKKLDPRKLREEFIYMLACKSSVKANQRLNIVEMEHLLWRLGQADNPFSCPHGRPTIISISTNELAKRFQRV